MTLSVLSPSFWTDDVPSNAIPALIGFCCAQGWRWGRTIWSRRRSRGPIWSDLRDGLTFVFVSEQQTREELRAQMTISNHCATLGITIDPELHYADQSLEKILNNNLIVIHTGATHTSAGSPTPSVLRGWLRGWTGASDVFQDVFHDVPFHDSAESGLGYLVRLPNPHRPARCIVVLSGPRPQSAWAAALWMCDPTFNQDPHAASGAPFIHRVTFGLTQGVPFVQSVTGEYLIRRGQDTRA